MYINDDDTTIAKTIDIPASATVKQSSFRAGKRFTTMQLELTASETIAPDIEIYRMEIELDE